MERRPIHTITERHDIVTIAAAYDLHIDCLDHRLLYPSRYFNLSTIGGKLQIAYLRRCFLCDHGRRRLRKTRRCPRCSPSPTSRSRTPPLPTFFSSTLSLCATKARSSLRRLEIFPAQSSWLATLAVYPQRYRKELKLVLIHS